ncbi:penicillin G acylase domain protein [Shigella sonnei str. Moseley]|nr:penicillin G acylase domain protein [Shigella sonnei 53G]EJL19852.1 penicillin G acylase domain protein [Shigella sonnei str. Moseley]OCC74001.1 penicillin acylase [Shigella sonnei]OCE42559.1 penicillin acylase [Shigella sonnei]CSP84110.1 penicillin G acylase [Shigella sonnei]
MVNGPQFGWYAPAYTYGIGLHGAGYDVTGNTPFAYPILGWFLVIMV